MTGMSPDSSNPAPDRSNRPDLSWIGEELRAARVNRFISFKPQDSATPEAFLQAIQPGDVVASGRGRELVLRIQPWKKGVELHCLVKPDPRMVGPEDFYFSDSRLRPRDVRNISEVLAQRMPGSEGVRHELLTPAVLHNAAVLTGSGSLGGDFRRAGFGSNRTVYVGIAPESGKITKVSPECSGLPGAVAEIETTTFLAVNQEPVVRIAFQSGGSPRLEVELEMARRLANIFERIDRLHCVGAIMPDKQS